MNGAVAAASADYPVDQTGGSYDFVGDYFPFIAPAPGHKISGPRGSFGTKWFWISQGGSFQGLNPGLIGHEMGHAYGARHASLWKTSDGNPVSAAGKIVEYSDTYDQMGSATGYTQPYIDFNPWVKWHFGWIDDAQVAIVTAPGTYQFRIFRFDSATATGLLAIKIPRGDGSNYWIGIRRNWVTTPLEMTGAYIIWGYDVLNHHSELIDCNTPGSDISDSALQVGQTLNDAPHGITITPVAIGGSDPNQYMDVQVRKQPIVSASTTFVTSTQPGTIRNDACGLFGMGITVGPNPITVNSLGRLVAPGNSQVHSLQIVDPVSGTTIASTTVNTQGGGAGAFVYGNLASPITLSANATYYILSQEVSGGDQWYDSDTTVTTTSDASLIGAVSGISVPYALIPNPNQEYVPLDFTYAIAILTPTLTPLPPPTPTPTVNVNVQTY